jgi:hypothetical protein
MKRPLIAASCLSLFAVALTASAVTFPQGPALFETSLQSLISSTETSMTLVANSVRGGGTLGGYNCFTIDEGRTDSEWLPDLDSNQDWPVNSRMSCHWTIWKELVETVGNAPTATILQGSSAPLCCPRGAWRWIRTNLSAPSTQGNHQIC